MSVGKAEREAFVLSGPVTLYESADVRDRLMAALQGDRDLAVDLETTGPWDLAGLQLLIAAAASGRKSALGVRFENVPRVCVEVAERAALGDWLREHSDSLL